ncbi:MAG TPA: right-handed parallel beta-helix repeat-containing protein [Thermodesulfobacteriota bacterium]|nr:right-handed parallel beta-helix repeat-containing protein [Thermodesulfobacteriota bacterium]
MSKHRIRLCWQEFYNRSCCKEGIKLIKNVFLINCLVLTFSYAVTSVAQSTDYYVSPNGKDGSSGTSASSAWKTFKYAVPKLKPGDTLILLDGTYSEHLSIDCTKNAFNGTKDKRISIIAQNERKAFLKGDGGDPPFSLRNCSYWIIEGIRAESKDNADTTAYGMKGHVFHIMNSSDITLGRLLGAFPNRYTNTHVFNIANSAKILIEESEAYYFHRHGFSISNSSYVTLRRNYANSRGYADLSDGYRSINTKMGDEGFVFYLSTDSVMENNISENNLAIIDIGQRNTIMGNISLSNVQGFSLSHHPKWDSEFRDNTSINNVAYNNTSNGFFIRTPMNVVAENNTSIKNKDSGFKMDNEMSRPSRNVSWTIYPSLAVRNSLAVNNSKNGFRTDDVNEFSSLALQYLRAFANYRDYSTPGVSLSSSSSSDPKIGNCIVYIPSGSPLKKAGKDGKDIGANIIYRYENGELTDNKLWNQSTGQFPCGATVPGINDGSDFPDSACVNVHKRLNVGVNGCSIP